MITDKIYLEDLDSPRRELSNGGLGIVVALLVCWGINFCVHISDAQSSCICRSCRMQTANSKKI